MIDHHAILLVGSLVTEATYSNVELKKHSELEIFRCDVLGISDVRKLIQSAYSKPFVHKTKTIIIEAAAIATEAQHALLKVLEEPPVSTKFILRLQTKSGLLPTLLSRLAVPMLTSVPAYAPNELFILFRQSSIAVRLQLIAKITKEKDFASVDLLCEGVRWLLFQKPIMSEAALISDCVTRMSLRGSSKKMLLEELALTLPVVA